MGEDELFEKLGKINSSNPDLANRMYELWKEDNTRDYSTLEKLAGVGFDAKAKKELGKLRSPVTEAFNISEDQYRLLVDPNSKINWTTLPTKELLKAAIKGGYVEDVPKNASEEEKREQRENFGLFLNMLANESNLQGRRNAIREYENTKFTEDPIGWAQKGLNNTLFRTYAKRAKEQAMKGEGATDFLDMNAGDVGALSGDIGVNAMLGAGAGGISSALLGRGVGYGGLRTFGNVAGSDLAAGVLGGAGAVLNRDVNTDDGARWYEYGTEPLITGATNVLATPAVLREAVGSASRLVGIGGSKINGMGKRNLLQSAQRFADEKYAEPALAAKLQEMEANVGRTIENSPVSEQTKAKIDNMFDILNDGATSSPNSSESLFDGLQALYESSARKGTGVKGDVQTGGFHFGHQNSPMVELVTTPSEGRFRLALDKKINELEGSIKNEAGKEAAPEMQRELNYYKNFRDMMDNGLIDARSYLHNTQPSMVFAPKTEYVLTGKTADVPFFELGKKPSQSDIDFIKDYVNNVNKGYNISYDNGLATRVRELADKYPEFGRYVLSQRTVPGTSLSVWSSRGKDVGLEGLTPSRRSETNLFAGNGERSYGHKTYDNATALANKAPWSAKDILNATGYGARDVAMDLVKPAVVEARLMKYDKPDNSLDELTRKYEKLRSEKPEAVDAAMSWKFDPRLAQNKQLTSEERDLLDRFREAKRKEVLGEY